MAARAISHQKRRINGGLSLWRRRRDPLSWGDAVGLLSVGSMDWSGNSRTLCYNPNSMRFARGRVAKNGLKLAALACGLGLLAFPQKKKDETQMLQLPRDLPTAVEGDPRKFTFHVTPLSAKGLLTKQVRDAQIGRAHV